MGIAGLTSVDRYRCPENPSIFAIMNRFRCIACRIVDENPTDHKPDESTKLPTCQNRVYNETVG